jgi:hypothetical protein
MKKQDMILIALVGIALYILMFRGTSGFRNLPGGVVTALPRQDGDMRSTAYSYNKGAFSLWGNPIDDS